MDYLAAESVIYAHLPWTFIAAPIFHALSTHLQAIFFSTLLAASSISRYDSIYLLQGTKHTQKQQLQKFMILIAKAAKLALAAM